MEPEFKIMVALFGMWMLFIACAVGTAIYIIGRWLGVL